MTKILAPLALALAAGLHLAPASAAELIEADLGGGGFSSDWRAPTEVPAGIHLISGTGAAGDPDFLRLELVPGAQTLSFAFLAPDAVDDSYSAGGQLLWSEAPLQWSAWEGALGGAFALDVDTRRVDLDLDLPDAFAGDLHLSLHFTYGTLAWVLNLPGAPAEGAPDLSPFPDLDEPTSPSGGGDALPREDGAPGAAAAVPVPAAGLLLALGLAALAGLRRARRAARA